MITKRHAATIFEADAADLLAAIATAKRVAPALRAALGPDGLNMLQANGPPAFQSVPHFHLHLIPRWAGDGKGFDWPRCPGDREAIARTGERSAPPSEEEPHERAQGPGGVAKPGLDGHDRGAKIVARALRDAGFEVIYTGLHQTPEQIVATAVQEDADAIGLSRALGRAQLPLQASPGASQGEGSRGHRGVRRRHHPAGGHRGAQGMGVKELFTPGTSTQDIIRFVHDNIRAAV